MSTPIALPADLGVYLADPAIDSARATLMISLVQGEAETYVFPLPLAAMGRVLAAAGRAYTNVTSAHDVALGSGRIGYGAPQATQGVGGLYLSRSDIQALRRMAGRSGAFSIDLLPGAVPPTTVPNMTVVAPSGATTGALVTVTGWGFTGTTTVTLGGVAASFDVTTDVQIVFAIPAGTPGTVALFITNAVGTSAPFSYVRA